MMFQKITAYLSATLLVVAPSIATAQCAGGACGFSGRSTVVYSSSPRVTYSRSVVRTAPRQGLFSRLRAARYQRAVATRAYSNSYGSSGSTNYVRSYGSSGSTNYSRSYGSSCGVNSYGSQGGSAYQVQPANDSDNRVFYQEATSPAATSSVSSDSYCPCGPNCQCVDCDCESTSSPAADDLVGLKAPEVTPTQDTLIGQSAPSVKQSNNETYIAKL